ncbi:hypothetical protein D3C73_1339400 [compost metagenome]
MRRITGGTHRFTRLPGVLNHWDQQRLGTDVQQLLNHHRVVPRRAYHRLARIRRNRLQLAQHRLDIVGRMLAVDQQPIKAGAGQQFCTVATA